ncbi:MAG TPA: ECF transporter S component [Bacillota bacterium]|nr:ECF transporter S component [Bacillota bacterium]
MKFSTRQITVAGLLSALTVVLGVTGMGLLPVPTPAVFATIMHVPVVLGGVLEGPLIGGFIGLLFGLFTLTAVPDPRIVIPARLVIGLVSYYVYRTSLRFLGRQTDARGKVSLRFATAGALAGLFGTVTNTVGTLTLAVIFEYINVPVAVGIAVSNGIPEAVIAALIVGALMSVLGPIYDRRSR